MHCLVDTDDVRPCDRPRNRSSGATSRGQRLEVTAQPGRRSAANTLKNRIDQAEHLGEVDGDASRSCLIPRPVAHVDIAPDDWTIPARATEMSQLEDPGPRPRDGDSQMPAVLSRDIHDLVAPACEIGELCPGLPYQWRSGMVPPHAQRQAIQDRLPRVSSKLWR